MDCFEVPHDFLLLKAQQKGGGILRTGTLEAEGEGHFPRPTHPHTKTPTTGTSCYPSTAAHVRKQRRNKRNRCRDTGCDGCCAHTLVSGDMYVSSYSQTKRGVRPKNGSKSRSTNSSSQHDTAVAPRLYENETRHMDPLPVSPKKERRQEESNVCSLGRKREAPAVIHIIEQKNLSEHRPPEPLQWPELPLPP